MKKIYRYSEKKFNSFSQQKQLAIVLEMLSALEKSFTMPEYATALQKSLQECFTYLDNSNHVLILDQNKYDLTQLADVVHLRDELLKSTNISLRDSDIIIKRYDSIKNQVTKFPLIVILDNLRSAFNVGSIIRSCECLGVSQIALCGNTPGLENKKVVETAMSTSDYVKITSFKSVQESISYYREQGFEIIALELTHKSLALQKYQPASKVAIIVGNESLGVAEETLEKCDKIIEIGMYGIKNSLNVSNATAIAIYNIIHKMEVTSD